MNKPLILVALIVMTAPVAAEPVDMTGISCSRLTNYGEQTWDFFGDVAIRYYGDGSVSRLPRIGEGAYEKYNKEGEWTSVYYFFDEGEGVQLRILARPGLLVREQNRAAPLEKIIVPFNAKCVPLSKDS